MDRGIVVCGSANQVIKIVRGLYSQRRSQSTRRPFNNGRSRGRAGHRGRGRGNGRGSGRGTQTRGRIAKYSWRGAHHASMGYRADAPCPEIDNLCIVGDSIALRMVKTITQYNSNGGLTTEILKDNLKTNYLNYQQKDVLVMIGTNDILQNVESENILKNFNEIITELHRKKVGVIYLVTVPLSPKLALHNDGTLEKLNEEIIKLIDSLENNVNVIDCQDVFVDNGEVCMKYFEKSYAEGKYNNVHPNSHGLETLYECITSNMP